MDDTSEAVMRSCKFVVEIAQRADNMLGDNEDEYAGLRGTLCLALASARMSRLLWLVASYPCNLIGLLGGGDPETEAAIQTFRADAEA